MTSQSLFKTEPLQFKPDSARKEPLLWIRRLVVLDALKADARVIRDVSLRRGLNIVCTSEPEPAGNSPVGHSVGKTLFVRLLRYCLGETRFSTEIEQQAIAGKFRNGFVAAEIQLAGDQWVVARPIGFSAHSADSWAAQITDIRTFLSDEKKWEKLSVFTATIEKACAQCFKDMLLLHSQREARWLDLLAWLSRDQQCRYRHHNEWRDAEAQSGTGPLPLEDAGLVIRMAMDLLDRSERKLRAKHEQLLAESDELQEQEKALSNHLSFYERDMKRLLDLPEDDIKGELFAATVVKVALERKEQEERKLKVERANSNSSLAKAIASERKLSGDIAVVDAKLRDTTATVKAKKADFEQMKRASDEEFFASFDPQGGWCRLFTTKERAKEMGCPLKGDAALPGAADPRRQARMKEAEKRLEELEVQVAELERTSKALQPQYKNAEAHLARLREQTDNKLAAIQKKIWHYENAKTFVKDFDAKWQRLQKLIKQRTTNDKAIAQSLDAQNESRKGLLKRSRALSGYFDAVLKRLIGSNAGGTIEIDNKGIRPVPDNTIASKGEALSTFSTVLGFDLACLLAGMCGLGHHPGLLIHDSPREADMEEPMYHELFRLMVELEQQFGKHEPNFQYIVTTTTRPPKELVGEPWNRLELDASKPDGRFLKTRF